MGKVDRIIRFIVGAVVVGFAIYYKSWFGIIGAILLVTAIVGICPGYVPFKLSTKSKDRVAEGE